MSSSSNIDQSGEQHFTPYALSNATRWTRVKFGWSLLMMPFTIALFGKCIRIRVEEPGEKTAKVFFTGALIAAIIAMLGWILLVL